MPRKAKRNAAAVSPLAAFVQQAHDRDKSYGRMVARALENGIYVTPETFRKAADDRYKTQLRPHTIRQLAEGLGVDTEEIRRLDDLNPRWRRTESHAITEHEALEFFRRALPAHLAEHIISQYFILRDAAEKGPPDPPKSRRKVGDAAPARIDLSPDNGRTEPSITS